MKIIYHDGHVAECPEDQELEVIRHSAAHILAQAVKRLYPQAHFAYGPAYPGVDEGLLLRALGMAPDSEKIRYYLLLDELF